MKNQAITKTEKKRKKEQFVVAEMIALYCRKKHTPDVKGGLCPDCRELCEYAQARSEHCPFMEEKGYREESYEEWKENDMRTELFAESMEELVEKKVLLDMLQEALESLMPEEKELAVKVFGEEMSVYEFARINGGNRRTLDFRKNKVLEKLRKFFKERGIEV